MPTIGSFFSQADLDERQRVLLLGSDVAAELFPNDEYPIDQTVQVNGLNFRVIGVMESKGGGPGGNLDNSAFIPLTTAQDRIFRQKTVNGQYPVSVIYASVADAERIPEAQLEITELMRERRNIRYLDADDFSIISQNDLIAVFGDILGALTIFLGAIAAISLLVGGIGIMNIMLVSVTERTREIGLRKAVGAKRRDVLIQFLIEAITMAVVGGMIGIAMGSWRMLARRSSPAPVSTLGLGRGTSSPVGFWSYCMKTRFHISRYSSSLLTPSGTCWARSPQ